MRNTAAIAEYCLGKRGLWLLFAGAVGISCAAASGVAADSAVTLASTDNGVSISVDGEKFAEFRNGKDLAKPFLIDVRSAGGAIVTRPLEKPEDHPHHKGVWCSIDEVNGIKFWAEKGKIENVKTELLTPKGNPAKMRITNHWLDTDGKPLLVETTTISIFANRLLSYDIQFAAQSKPVLFEDTKEGLFGIRLANSLRESQGGKVINAEGLQGTLECWGKQSPWVDYYGDVDGQTHGVTLFDHPENPRKSRYHVRNYGLFTISPFGEKAYTNGASPEMPLELKPGEKFRLRYGLYVHPGDTESAKVADVFETWRKDS